MTRLLNIFATIAGVLSIQADPFADDLVASFMALLGTPDVHNFIDQVLIDAPPPVIADNRELGEVPVGRDLSFDPHPKPRPTLPPVPFCSNCKTIHSTAINAYFIQQITNICKGKGNADSLSTVEFCGFLQKGLSTISQVLNGYIFVRSRALQLATATCIGTKQCPTKDAFNPFFNPIVPGRLVDFTRFGFCPRWPFHTVEACFGEITEKMLQFAFGNVLNACDSLKDEDLFEFCGYVATDKSFGLGLVYGYVGVFEQATGYCVRDQCH
ncbi:hypothetical protein Pmar_PMAR029170 [Perkinsus marinus ATCC 50983]|uniref:Saposin B-type domain-containing protein n=1 Tax=Perkinsus marinus (strain ATCC 50983 / TXsc) TaxID=423536 RepID=C5M0T9_PERM5|nr:hypothetical protein Pmar_PMAR029170 [Perkinsus marinus ATCC 50983]EEQ97447.1 hypothetical protein Pmar_PMAR029170 [Perkinsus marinus ATCC 50983]|eukprot:XP_002764730.1 hypothetical protein Pmar_PMAR029170 [Perkinsus marinus ATCC 50983]